MDTLSEVLETPAWKTYFTSINFRIIQIEHPVMDIHASDVKFMRYNGKHKDFSKHDTANYHWMIFDSTGRNRILSIAECKQLGFNVIDGTGTAVSFFKAFNDRRLSQIKHDVREYNGQRSRQLSPIYHARESGYRDYIISPEWKQKRQLVISRDQHRCTQCARNQILQVHHETYFTLGHERWIDLTTLCKVCHAKEHGRQS
jgi:hypothetical protein